MALIYSQYQLNEIAHVFNGKTPAKSEQRDTGHPVLKIKNVSEDQKFKGNFESFVDEDLAIKSKSKLINLDDTLILNAAHNADYVGSKQYRAESTVVNALPTGEWLIVRARHEKVDPIYLNYWFRLGDTKFKIRNLVKGIHLYPKDVAKLKIPLPPLAEQKQIAAILDAADSLRQKDQQLVEHYTALSQSLFFEMFGDPVTNPNNWSTVLLDEISEIVSGVTKGRKLNNGETFDIPYMRVANVQDGHLNLNEIKYIPGTKNDLEKYALKQGDVLLTEGGDPDKLGRGAVWNNEIENCIHQNHIFRVRLTCEASTPLFLSKLCGSEYGKRYFLKSGKQTTGIASINKTQLKRFPVLRPPIELQNQFAERIAIIEKQKQQAQTNLQKSEALFNSLLQRAFTGELTANKAA